ncbi:MAG: PASTA domain-containing protein [Lachnospira sp.]
MIKKINLRIIVLALTTMLTVCGCGSNDSATQHPVNATTESTKAAKEETSSKTQESTTKATTAAQNAKLPDVVGKSLDNAKALLESAGFKVRVNEEYSDTVGKNMIISQSPTVDNNLNLKEGDTVTIAVSLGKKVKEVQYLDTIVYSSFISESTGSKMSAYSGKDIWGNECTRAIKFVCDNNKNNYSNPNGTQTVKAIYTLDETRTSFSCKLSPLSINNRYATDINYIHVNLYKDDTVLYSMDISKDSKMLELSYDLTGASTFTIELQYETKANDNYSNGSIILSEARFE